MYILRVEFAGRRKEYGILFTFRRLCDYTNLENVRIHVIYRAVRAEYIVHGTVAAPPGYVNTDRGDASSMVTAGATASNTKGNSRASRESGLLCSYSHGESIDT